MFKVVDFTTKTFTLSRFVLFWVVAKSLVDNCLNVDLFDLQLVRALRFVELVIHYYEVVVHFVVVPGIGRDVLVGIEEVVTSGVDSSVDGACSCAVDLTGQDHVTIVLAADLPVLVPLGFVGVWIVILSKSLHSLARCLQHLQKFLLRQNSKLVVATTNTQLLDTVIIFFNPVFVMEGQCQSFSLLLGRFVLGPPDGFIYEHLKILIDATVDPKLLDMS